MISPKIYPMYKKTIKRKIRYILKVISKLLKKYFIPKKYEKFFRWHMKNYGLAASLYVYIKLLTKYLLNKPILVELKIPDYSQKVWIRPLPGDTWVFDEIFRYKIYDIECKNAEYIIDAGAHIGLASVFFALKFRNATILCIEPEKKNYKLLIANTKNFKNIVTLKAALWTHHTLVSIINPEAVSCEFRTEEVEMKNDIKTITLDDAISKLNDSTIDILKIDIEGSEVKVLKNNVELLENVKYLIVEEHDKNRLGCSETINSVIEQTNFLIIERVDSNIILRNKRFDP